MNDLVSAGCVIATGDVHELQYDVGYGQDPVDQQQAEVDDGRASHRLQIQFDARNEARSFEVLSSQLVLCLKQHGQQRVVGDYLIMGGYQWIQLILISVRTEQRGIGWVSHRF